MRKPGLIVFAFSCLSTIGASVASLPACPAETGAISLPQAIQVAQQGPMKAKPAQRQRQNSRHKVPAPDGGKPSSAPESDDIHTRLAPGS
jgi:hypothetical protein